MIMVMVINHHKLSLVSSWKMTHEIERSAIMSKLRYDKDLATMVRVIREFLKIPETVFTTQVIWQLAPHQPTLILIFQEILDICGVLNVNAHELPVTPTPTQVFNVHTWL